MIITITAAIITVIAAVGLSSRCLTLRDSDSGRLIARWPVDEGAEFSIEFVHSVNQTPVRDVFVVAGMCLRPVETFFFSYGAGMQSELEPGQTLVTHDDGSQSITGYNTESEALHYIVGTVSDHVLTIGGDDLSLRDFCGRSAAVTLRVERELVRAAADLIKP